MEAEEQEANKKDDGNTPKDTEIQMEDPRGGITRWLKGGLLELVMGDQAVSKQKIKHSKMLMADLGGEKKQCHCSI